MSEVIQNRMSLKDLQKTREYWSLTQKQQLFVATYVANGIATGNYNAQAATYSSYNCKSQEVARCLSYTLMQNVRIVAVLNMHFGKDPIKEFEEMLDRAIRSRKITTAQIEALKLKSVILGLTGPPVRRGMKRLAEEVERSEKKAKRPAKGPTVKTWDPDEA